ncbi:MAG: hypothetical protein ACD_6C00089G0001 [uncultured bacterium]|nr:MAG: hypothetical protein ACD_6C00089G0001 [uncultured bacterium]
MDSSWLCWHLYWPVPYASAVQSLEGQDDVTINLPVSRPEYSAIEYSVNDLALESRAVVPAYAAIPRVRYVFPHVVVQSGLRLPVGFESPVPPGLNPDRILRRHDIALAPDHRFFARSPDFAVPRYNVHSDKPVANRVALWCRSGSEQLPASLLQRLRPPSERLRFDWPVCQTDPVHSLSPDNPEKYRSKNRHHHLG